MEPVEGQKALPVVEAGALGEEAVSTVVQPVGKERRSPVAVEAVAWRRQVRRRGAR
jgi:hypothetical protein